MMGRGGGPQMLMIDVYYRYGQHGDFATASALGVVAYLLAMGAALVYDVVHGASELVREYRERFGFAVFVFQFRKIFFPRLTLPDEEDRGFGKRPAQMHVADLFA